MPLNEEVPNGLAIGCMEAAEAPNWACIEADEDVPWCGGGM